MTTKVSKNLVGDGFVLDTGDTMTGDLTIETAGHVDLKVISTELGNLARLTLANTGNNIGCQLFAGTGQVELHRTSGAGVSVGRVFAANGTVIQFDDQPTSPSTQGTSVDALTRKDYVDGNFVELAGDTMTGDLLINHGTTPILTLKPASASGFPAVKFKDSSDNVRGSLHLNEATGGMAIVEYSAIGAVESQLEFTANGNVTVNGTAPTAANQLTRKDYVDSVASTPPTINWTSALPIGNALAYAGAGGNFATLTNTDVAHICQSQQTLRTYRWDGKNWAQVGAGLSIPSIGPCSITALDSTTIVFIDDALESLRTYSWSGSAWSLVGSGLSISGITYPAITALTSTTIAFIDDTLESLRMYSWDAAGSPPTWSLVGSGLSITGLTFPEITAINSTDVAFLDGTLESLRTYRWGGSPAGWSLVGSGLTISGISTTALASLNSTDLAAIVSSKLKVYRFNGSTWTQIGGEYNIASTSSPGMAAINGTDVVAMDAINDEIVTYRFGYDIGDGPYRP